MHKLNLLVDGNYMLNKLVFPLFKEKRLYGDLHHELKYTLRTYANMYNFNNIDLVCDSHEKSWRKSVYPEYKSHRVKDDEINWEFVNTVYDEFISEIREEKKINVYRKNKIEGDDYISYLLRKYNSDGISCLVMTNDRDICQLVESKNGCYINILFNDQGTKDKVFIPKTFNSFLKSISNQEPMEYVFDITLNETLSYDNNDNDISSFLYEFVFQREKNEVVGDDILIQKLICGDRSDNIKSPALYKNRGIGDAGFVKFYDAFVSKYSVPVIHDNVEDNHLLFMDLVKEFIKFKKVPDEEVEEHMKLFYDRLVTNFKIIYLKKLPSEIEDIIKSDIGRKKSIF